MNLFERLSKRAKKVIDDKIGKTVIHFTTHGCQGQDNEFDFIGTIVDTTYPKYCNGKMFYKVEILKGKGGEKRDGNLVEEFSEVPSWYLQNLGGDFYIAYD